MIPETKKGTFDELISAFKTGGYGLTVEDWVCLSEEIDDLIQDHKFRVTALQDALEVIRILKRRVFELENPGVENPSDRFPSLPLSA